jgi:hypothetical protein
MLKTVKSGRLYTLPPLVVIYILFDILLTGNRKYYLVINFSPGS